MFDYSTITSKILESAKIREDELPIKNEKCRSQFFLNSYATEKVFLFFHGFTAGPYQFEALGQSLFQAGYNVLVPLQPGHGIAGDFSACNLPPLGTDIKVYQEFAIYWLELARKLGAEVIVGGISTGGVLAAWLGLEYPQVIKQNLLFAPYLSGANKLVDFAVNTLPFYYEWINKDNPGNFGYHGFYIPALRIFFNLGKEVLQRVEIQATVPAFIVASESDLTVNHQTMREFFQKVSKQQPQSWYHSFDKILEIPHTMLTTLEGNKYLDLLISIANAYVESDATWDEIIKIGDLMLQGDTFEAAVGRLDLALKVCPELSVFLSILDKKVIVNGGKFS